MEAAAERHTLVAGAAALSVPDAWGGETIPLFVEPRKDTHLAEDDVARFCSKPLPRFMLAHQMTVVREFPRNGLQRVEKHRLLINNETRS